MHDRAHRYKSKEAAINFIQGRLLLTHGLQFLGLDIDLEQLQFTDTRKPHLPQVNFNISHSANLVVCAFSSRGDIGIDIEVPRDAQIEHLRHSFTSAEWANIENDPLYPQLFYKLWCRKESILKAADISLAQLHNVKVDAYKEEINFNDLTWYIKALNLPNCEDVFGAICTANPICNIEYHHVALDF